MVIMTSKSQNAQQCQGCTHLIFDVGPFLMSFLQKPRLPQILRGCQNIGGVSPRLFIDQVAEGGHAWHILGGNANMFF